MALEVKAKNNDKAADIWLYGDIGEGWGDCISAKMVADELKKLNAATNIKVHINSPGGCVFDGLAMYNSFRKHAAIIDVEIDGLAASIASIIAMSGNSVSMAENAIFMIHNPWSMAWGEAKDFRETADRLDVVRGSLLTTYGDKVRGKSTLDQVSNWMNAETWFTAEQALQFGFVDAVTNELSIAAKIGNVSKYNFKNIPENVLKNVSSTQGDRYEALLAGAQEYVKQLGLQIERPNQNS